MRLIPGFAVVDVGRGVSPDDPRLGMTERDLQESIVALARTLGWLTYHTFDSRKSEPGFPDLVLVKRGHPVLYAEVKTTKGRISESQWKWLDALAATGAHVHLWRPSDWITGRIDEVLK